MSPITSPQLEKALQSYLDMVNPLLATATPIGAYCMGLSGPLVLADDLGKRPTLALMKRLRACATVSEGSRIIETWLNGRCGVRA